MQNRTNKFLLYFVILTLLSCNRKKADENSIKYFEFSYNDTFHSSYTLIYKPKDSLYFRQHWSASDAFDSLKIPRGKTNYAAKINPSEEKKLVELISALKLRKLKNEYFEDYSDGTTYSIFIDKDSINKLVAIHSHNIPKELDSLARWIREFKEKVKIKKTEKKLEFKSSKYVLPPPPPPPIIEKNKNGI
jgi:hypothetical protein